MKKTPAQFHSMNINNNFGTYKIEYKHRNYIVLQYFWHCLKIFLQTIHYLKLVPRNE